MAKKEVLETFFKEQLQTSGGSNFYTDLFLYKDKQLLKENRLKEFAEHQIDKAKKYLLVSIIQCIYCFIIFFLASH